MYVFFKWLFHFQGGHQQSVRRSAAITQSGQNTEITRERTESGYGEFNLNFKNVYVFRIN